MFLFILASFVEAYYLCKSSDANKRDRISYAILCICSLPIIPIIVLFIAANYSLKEIWVEYIKPYWFELLVYIGLLIAGIILW